MFFGVKLTQQTEHTDRHLQMIHRAKLSKCVDMQTHQTGSSSSSNWILMSCQPHRVTSGQSNSGHKQIHVSKSLSFLTYISTLCQVFSHIYQPSVKSSHIYINPFVKSIYKTNHKSKHTQTWDTNFWRVSPFNITTVKRAHKARTCWYRRPFCLIYWYQVKEKLKKRNGQTQYKI